MSRERRRARCALGRIVVEGLLALKTESAMTAKPRSEIFSPDEQAIVHVMNRCVRSCFLFEQDPQTGQSYGHRHRAFEKELEKAARGFSIDLLSYAIMDNHFHLMLRSRPDILQQWDDLEVIKHWHILCPIFKDELGVPIPEPSRYLLEQAAQDTEQVATWRSRLSDISWFMKLVSERIAKWCNAEDGITGHFWEGRFKGVLLLDERALLTCSMYVDLNRIQAEMARSIESSDFTAIQRRIRAFAIRTSMRGIMAESFGSASQTSTVTTVLIDENESDVPDASQTHAGLAGVLSAKLPDAHLAPLPIDEKNDPIGPHLSSSGTRCSDKGFLPITEEQYMELLRWTTDQLRQRKDGRKFDDSPPTLKQLQLEPDVWCKLVTEFTDLFFVVAGMPESIDNQRSCQTGKRFYMPQKTRELLGG